jgi:hypothetical protein
MYKKLNQFCQQIISNKNYKPSKEKIILQISKEVANKISVI